MLMCIYAWPAAGLGPPSHGMVPPPDQPPGQPASQPASNTTAQAASEPAKQQTTGQLAFTKHLRSFQFAR